VGAVGDPVVEALLLGKSADAAERGIELAIESTLPESDVPARDLVTVAGNLVDNAMDAVVGRAERRVAVRIEVTDGRFTITVGDSGPGLAEEDRARVLERGWSTKAGGAGGRGLGLALVAQVARRHGGGVHIGTSPYGGAAFTVTLGPARSEATT
jgi:sensor histidine kinase regulating citrate/malate metabolism